MSDVSAAELDQLRDEYVKLKNLKAETSREVREKYRKIIADEIEMITRAAERAFAVQLVELRERGATRRELVEVIGDGTAATMRHYVELGGGSVRSRETGADRLEKRIEEIGERRTELLERMDLQKIGEDLYVQNSTGITLTWLLYSDGVWRTNIAAENTVADPWNTWRAFEEEFAGEIQELARLEGKV